LLAKGLYDAFRETERDQIPRKLDRAAELSDRGLNEPAQQLENQAREGISNLRENIDRAAERVLGDGIDALRMAVRLLEDLERQLGDEIDQFDETQPRDSQPEQDQRRGGERPGEPIESESDKELGGQLRETAEQSERDSERQTQNSQQQQHQERDQDEQRRQQEGQPGEQPGQSEQRSDREQQEGLGRGQPSEQQRDQESQESSQNQQGSPSQQQDQNSQQQSSQRQPNTLRQGGSRQRDGGGLGGWEQLQIAPITGEDFREWSDRLRDVEEIVADPELRAEAARIRERARSFRREFKRHSDEPKWNLIKETVARPLRELRQQVSEELLRRSGAKNALVPIDRDPVPEQFAEQVRRYYENLGRGE
jgi:hypothetical protein